MTAVGLLQRDVPMCAECGSPHYPEFPHNPASSTYVGRFVARHGRAPTWSDAMAHCSPGVKERAKKILREIKGAQR